MGHRVQVSKLTRSCKFDLLSELRPDLDYRMTAKVRRSMRPHVKAHRYNACTTADGPCIRRCNACNTADDPCMIMATASCLRLTDAMLATQLVAPACVQLQLQLVSSGCGMAPSWCHTMQKHPGTWLCRLETPCLMPPCLREPQTKRSRSKTCLRARRVRLAGRQLLHRPPPRAMLCSSEISTATLRVWTIASCPVGIISVGILFGVPGAFTPGCSKVRACVEWFRDQHLRRVITDQIIQQLSAIHMGALMLLCATSQYLAQSVEAGCCICTNSLGSCCLCC